MNSKRELSQENNITQGDYFSATIWQLDFFHLNALQRLHEPVGLLGWVDFGKSSFEDKFFV